MKLPAQSRGSKLEASRRGEGVASVIRLPLNKKTQFKHRYTKLTRQQTNVGHIFMNERKKKITFFNFKGLF